MRLPSSFGRLLRLRLLERLRVVRLCRVLMSGGISVRLQLLKFNTSKEREAALPTTS